MAIIPFGPFQPDLTDLATNVTATILNAVPRGDGYGPHPSPEEWTTALPAACRGYFYARNADASVTVFAGTATKLYRLNNTTFAWVDVSAGGGSYSTLPAGDMWRFVQFNDVVLAAMINAAPQSYNLTSSTEFAALAGSPPQARHISIVNRFVVLSGISGFPYRVQWSGLNSITTWDNVTLQSNFQDLADGGLAHEVAGGEFGYIFQDASIRRMTFAPGSPYTFQIDRVAEDDGLFGQYAVVRAGDEIHFVSPQGFKKIAPGGYPVPIGKERVDATFSADVDVGNLQLLMGAADPTNTRVYWAYKSLAGDTGLFDTVLVYDRALDRWAKLEASGEYLATMSRPGLTLEALDAIATGIITISSATGTVGQPIRLTISSLTAGTGLGQTNLNSANHVVVYGVNGTTEANATWAFSIVDGTHIDLTSSVFTNAYTSGGQIGGSIDLMTISFDSISNAALSKLSMVNSSHIMAFFSGSNLEAIVETPEQDGGGVHIFVTGFRVMTDAPTVYGSLFSRNKANTTTLVQTTETLINDQGICPQRLEARYIRARSRVVSAQTWTYIMGVEPQFVPAGER